MAERRGVKRIRWDPTKVKWKEERTEDGEKKMKCTKFCDIIRELFEIKGGDNEGVIKKQNGQQIWIKI